MSFILDALKKLEQKRQQGAVPDLMTMHAPERQKHQKHALWPYLVVGALVLNAGILAAVFRPWVAENKKPAVHASAAQQQKTSPESPVKQPVRKDRPASASSQGKISTAVPDKKPPVPKASSGPVKNAADTKKTVPVPEHEHAPAAVEAEIKEPVQIEETAANNIKTSAQDTSETLGLNPAPHELELLRKKIKEETSSQGAVPLRKVTAVKNAEAGPDERVPDISQLPEETKKELPPITISAHIYSNSPRSRIVNINGSTIKEGDDVTKGLKLREITMSGVILEYQGRRFQVRAF